MPLGTSDVSPSRIKRPDWLQSRVLTRFGSRHGYQRVLKHPCLGVAARYQERFCSQTSRIFVLQINLITDRAKLTLINNDGKRLP